MSDKLSCKLHKYCHSNVVTTGARNMYDAIAINTQ